MFFFTWGRAETLTGVENGHTAQIMSYNLFGTALREGGLLYFFLLTLKRAEVLQLYEDELVRWIFYSFS